MRVDTSVEKHTRAEGDTIKDCLGLRVGETSCQGRMPSYLRQFHGRVRVGVLV